MSWKNWMCGLAIFAAACGGNEEEARLLRQELGIEVCLPDDALARQLGDQVLGQLKPR